MTKTDTQFHLLLRRRILAHTNKQDQNKHLPTIILLHKQNGGGGDWYTQFSWKTKYYSNQFHFFQNCLLSPSLKTWKSTTFLRELIQ